MYGECRWLEPGALLLTDTFFYSKVWNMFEGGTLFDGTDPEHGEYRERAHLAEMIALLGPPPSGLLARADLRSEFFSDAGKLRPLSVLGADPGILLSLTTLFIFFSQVTGVRASRFQNRDHLSSGRRLSWKRMTILGNLLW